MTWGDFKGLVAQLNYADDDDIVTAIIHHSRPGGRLVFEVDLRHSEIRFTSAPTAATAAGTPPHVTAPGPDGPRQT